MKKVIAGLLAAVFVVGMLSGCAGLNLTIKDESAATPSPTSRIKDIPEYVMEWYDKFIACFENNKFELKITLPPKKGNRTSGGNNEYTLPTYSFAIFGTQKLVDDNSSVSFQAISAQEPLEVSKTLQVSYDTTQNMKVFRQIITATFMLLDSSLSREQAEEKMQTLINSYSYDNYSEIMEFGDYYLYLTPKKLLDYVYFYVRPKDEMWLKINEDDYMPLVYETFQAPALNDGVKASVIGTVKNLRQGTPINVVSSRFFDIHTDDGKQYRASYDFEIHPVELEIDRRYQFYGKIESYGDSATFTVDKCVPLD